MTPLSRKEFLQKACAAGVCLCGFGSLGLTNGNTGQPESVSEAEGNILEMHQAWISALLVNLSNDIKSEDIKGALKSCAAVHYKHLRMDELLKPYIGNLDKFIEFLEQAWGWKIDYNKATRTIIANESKSYCVCPMVDKQKGDNSPTICYCSEGFAERMFSEVIGKSTSATVIASVLKGDSSCIYKVEF